MAGKARKVSSEGRERLIKPATKTFFLEGELVKQGFTDRGSNIVYVWNYRQQKDQILLYTDFMRRRRRAYSLENTAKLLDRDSRTIKNYILDGAILPPTTVHPENKRGVRINSFYSEDYIFEIRAYMATISQGRPRKDGYIRTRVLTEPELRAKMGDALHLYTKTADGKFIPTWNERIY